MLIVSVVVIAAVSAAYLFVPQFGEGVDALGERVKQILVTGDTMAGVGGGNDDEDNVFNMSGRGG